MQINSMRFEPLEITYSYIFSIDIVNLYLESLEILKLSDLSFCFNYIIFLYIDAGHHKI